MKHLLALGSLALAIVGCNGGPNQTNIEVIQNMMDQPSIKSQDWNPSEGDKLQMLTPPEHTVSQEYTPYAFASDPAGAEKQANPLAAQMEPKILEAGKKYYDIYCTVCHGADGAGLGLAAEKMAVKPRNLISADAKAYSDGRIYYAITQGKGAMKGYGSQITDSDKRWKIVNYVRSLQK
jgi:mono/diheme cytochrome c family protein